VTVGTLPLLLLMFQQFSLVSPLANALAIPLVSFVITPLALLFAVLPWPVLLHFDHWLLVRPDGCSRMARGLAGLGAAGAAAGGDLAGRVRGASGCCCRAVFPARWRGCACSCRRCSGRPRGRRRATPGWTCSMSGRGWRWSSARPGIRCSTTPGRCTAPSRTPASGSSSPTCARVGVDQLDALIVTHRDKDHSGGVVAFRRPCRSLVRLSSVQELPGERCVAGQTWEWDGVRFAVLHPQPPITSARPREATT
jgi:competence protein ComEC